MTSLQIILLAGAIFTVWAAILFLRAEKKEQTERAWFAKLCRDTHEETQAEARATNERKETACKAGPSSSPSSASMETAATAKSS